MSVEAIHDGQMYAHSGTFYSSMNLREVLADYADVCPTQEPRMWLEDLKQNTHSIEFIEFMDDQLLAFVLRDICERQWTFSIRSQCALEPRVDKDAPAFLYALELHTPDLYSSADELMVDLPGAGMASLCYGAVVAKAGSRP